jgi:hypothetical protein
MEYSYPVFTGFNKNSRFIRLYQTESGASSAVAHNVYFDGIWLYGSSEDGGDPGTNVGKESSAPSLKVYPNPTNGELNVVSLSEEIATLDIVSIATGAKLMSRKVNAQEAVVNVDMLPAGNYLMVTYNKVGKPSVVRFIKQ